MDWHDAVVRITGLQPAGKPYGTGFVVWQDDNPKQDDKVSLIVTCWHVVTTVGRDHLRIKNKPCQLVSEEGDDALDLAVLSVSGLPDKKPLIVSDQGRQDLVISIYGYGPEGRRLNGRLGQRTPTPHSKGDDLAYWDYYLDEEAAYFERIKDGYSGSPVYDPGGRHVVAVVTHRVGEDKGFAISVVELPRVFHQATAWLEGPMPQPDAKPIGQAFKFGGATSMRKLPEKIHVAFSFAGEQRELVRRIAEAVEARLGYGTVFLDEWFEHYLGGEDADLELQEIYGKRCELAVVCVAERYGKKPWTRAEHAAIRARYMQACTSDDERDRYRVLPIRVGDGDVEGINFNTIVPDVRGRTADAAADLIVSRLELALGELPLVHGDQPEVVRDYLQPGGSAAAQQAFPRSGSAAAPDADSIRKHTPPSIREDALTEIEDTLTFLAPLREALSRVMTDGTAERARPLAERLCALDADAFQGALGHFRDALDALDVPIRRGRADAAALREGATQVLGWMLVTTVLDDYDHDGTLAVQGWMDQSRVALKIPFGRSHCVEVLCARWLRHQARFGVNRYSWCTGEDDLMDRPLGELGFDHPAERDAHRLVAAIWKLLHQKLWPGEPLLQEIDTEKQTRIRKRMERKRRDKKHPRWFRLVVDPSDIQHAPFSQDALRAIAAEIPLLQLIVIDTGKDDAAGQDVFLIPPGELAAEIDECLERIDTLS
jgi:hypothetical protein